MIYVMMTVLLFMGCASQEMMRVRQMDIQNINANDIRDGEYIGSFSYGGFE